METVEPRGAIARWSSNQPSSMGELETPLAAALGTSGDGGAGLRPHDLLDAALAACTLETMLNAARESFLPIWSVRVFVSHDLNGTTCRLTRTIDFTGALDSDELSRLLSIVDQTPMQRTLAGHVDVVTFAQQRGEGTRSV
jgi:putative redox protein